MKADNVRGTFRSMIHLSNPLPALAILHTKQRYRVLFYTAPHHVHLSTPQSPSLPPPFPANELLQLCKKWSSLTVWFISSGETIFLTPPFSSASSTHLDAHRERHSSIYEGHIYRRNGHSPPSNRRQVRATFYDIIHTWFVLQWQTPIQFGHQRWKEQCWPLRCERCPKYFQMHNPSYYFSSFHDLATSPPSLLERSIQIDSKSNHWLPRLSHCVAIPLFVLSTKTIFPSYSSHRITTCNAPNLTLFRSLSKIRTATEKWPTTTDQHITRNVLHDNKVLGAR